jgi:hypothetical protein
MSGMVAVRLVLMMLMCLVTDVPGPMVPLVFEHLEDGEEVRLSRRRAVGQQPRLAQMPPGGRERTPLMAPSAPRPRPAARPAVQAHARKAPPPPDASSSLSTSEDH